MRLRRSRIEIYYHRKRIVKKDKPWDFYPDLFKKEQEAYEKAEEERQWQEYMERRREYNIAFNHRRQ